MSPYKRCTAGIWSAVTESFFFFFLIKVVCKKTIIKTHLPDLQEEGNKGRGTIRIDIHQPLYLSFPNLMLILLLLLHKFAACLWFVGYLHQIQDTYFKVLVEG